MNTGTFDIEAIEQAFFNHDHDGAEPAPGQWEKRRDQWRSFKAYLAVHPRQETAPERTDGGCTPIVPDDSPCLPNDQGSADQSRRMKTSNRKEPATAGFGRAASACSACGGCGMLPGIKPDDDVMNTPCPQCNPWAKAKTSTHEPAIAVHDVFSEAIPGAFGLPFLRRLLNKPNK